MLGNDGKKTKETDWGVEVIEDEFSSESPILHRNERPLAGKAQYWLPPEETPNSQGTYSEYPDLPPEEAGNEEIGPLDVRLESRNWKTRTRAYEELISELKLNQSLLSTYSQLLCKFLSDSHPSAQEKAFDLFQVYLTQNPKMLMPDSEQIIKTLIEKGVSSTKSNISKASTSLILDFFAEHQGNFEGFFEGISQCLNNKNSKVQSSALSIITLAMSSFGAKLVPFKPFLPTIEKLAGNSNAGVRNEAMNFYKEAYRWVRELIMNSVGKLKKAQQDELQKAFEEIEDAPWPTRWLRCEEGMKYQQEVPRNKQVDVYDMADAKDIFTRFNEKWTENVLEMDKWTDKKQALEILNAEANYPKLAEKSPLVLVAMAKRLINDSNVNVMIQSIKLIGFLAKGQRRYFEVYAKQFFPIFLSKLKDKKTQVIQEVFIGLEHLLYSLSLEQVLDDLREVLEDKTPTLKINVTSWLEKVYSIFPNEQMTKSVKPITLLVKKNTDDSVAEVRAATFKFLNILWKKYSDIVSPAIKDLPLPKIKKIEEDSEENLQEEVVEVKKPVKIEKEVKVENKSVKNEKKAEKVVKKDAKNEDEAPQAVPNEEAEEVLAAVIPVETLEKMKETSWKGKIEGLQELNTWIEENEERLNDILDHLFTFLKIVVKDWKESNINVIKATLDMVNFINSKATISKRSAYLVLTAQALDKLSDSKVADSFSACILSICESVSPKFVVSSIIKNTASCSKPKVVSECFSVISRIISDFGPHKVALKELVEYIKTALNQSNPVIKKSAQSTTVTLYSYLGENLLPLLTDIKDSTMKALQEDFSKSNQETNTEFKTVRGEEPAKYDAKKALDELIPRVNVSNSITQQVIKRLNDNNWKERKEALTSIEEVLDKSGKRIVPNGLDELFKALKARLGDSNKAIIRSTLGIISKLAECLGSEAAGFSKIVIPGVLGNLADTQSLLRQDALATIDKWAVETGAENIIMYVSMPLMQDNPEMRTELLNWLLAHKETFNKCDVKVMVPGIINCLQDKSVNIRNASEILFGEVVEIVGFDSFTPFLKDIKPAVMSSLKQVFDRYRSSEVIPDSVPKSQTLNKPAAKKASKTEIDSKTVRIKAPGLDIRIIDPGDKERRLDFDSRYKWSLDEIRPDYLEKLKEQLKAAVSPDLYSLMFHSDFKKQADAAVHLTNIIKSQCEQIIPYLDLLFKWGWIELIVTNNTQIYKAVFELDQLIINTLESVGYTLSDTEAGLIIPVLCEKSGQNNQTFRTMIRGIIHSACKVYAPDKLFTMVLQGINSKNAKSKVECIEVCGGLIVDYGIDILQTKDVKIITKQVASSDANVRNSAADTITEVYKVVGDKIWSVLGEVPDKIRGILDQRFKTVKVKNPELGKIAEVFKSQEPVKVPEKKVETAGKESKIGKIEIGKGVIGQITDKIIGLERLNFNQQDEDIEGKSPFSAERRESRSSTLSVPTSIVRIEPSPRSRDDNKGPRSIQDIRNAFKEKKMQQMRESQVFEPVEVPESPLVKVLKQLKNPDVSVKAEALQELNENILENSETYEQDFKINAKSLNGSVLWTMYFVNDSADELFSQYFFTVIQKLYTFELYVKELDENDLSSICEQFLIRITSDKNMNENILKTVNSILLKILDIAQPKMIFASTLMLMSKYKSQNTGKISKVLVRCLMKITKSLSAQIEYINIEDLLLNISKYLAAEEEVPDENGMKAMKTVINELVKIVGDEIWQFYENVRDDLPDSQIEDWIHLLLGTTPMVQQQIVITKSKNYIDEIFEKLVNEETYNEGFGELKEYFDKNPGVDFSEQLAALGPEIEMKVAKDLEKSRIVKKKVESVPYSFNDMQSRLQQMKMKIGMESNSATSSTTDLNVKASESGKNEGSSIPAVKSRIQKFSKK